MYQNVQLVTASHVVREIAGENYHLNAGICIMLEWENCQISEKSQLETTTNIKSDIVDRDVRQRPQPDY